MYKVHVWRIHSEPKHELKEAESGIPRDGAQRVIYFALATDTGKQLLIFMLL